MVVRDMSAYDYPFYIEFDNDKVKGESFISVELAEISYRYTYMHLAKYAYSGTEVGTSKIYLVKRNKKNKIIQKIYFA